MDRNQEEFAVPEAHTRLDTIASSAVLAVMLASILCGVVIVDTEAQAEYSVRLAAVGRTGH
jgi:hypothetical protein